MSRFDDERALSSRLMNESIPEAIKEFIAFGIYRYGTSLIEMLKQKPNEVCFSCNDVYCIFHNDFNREGKVVEFANPYVKKDFSVILFDEFEKMVLSLLDGGTTHLGDSVTTDPSERTDYDDSQELW